jgi:hypothetical protein
LRILVTDHRGPRRERHFSELAERHVRARVRLHQHTFERGQGVAELTCVSHVDRVALAAFNRLRDVLAAECGLNDLLHILDGEP